MPAELRRPSLPHSRRLLAVALLAVAAGCGGSRDAGAVRAALEGCERSLTPRGVRFDCAGFRADVEEYDGLTPIELIDMYAAEVKKLGDGCASSPFAADAGGRRWEGFRFSARRTNVLFSRPRERVIATARLGDGAARVASCDTFQWIARGRCEGVAEQLAATGPEPWRMAPGATPFLGRPVPVPSGCELRAGSAKRLEIRCGTEAALTAMVLGSRDDMASTVDIMREVLHRGANEAIDEEARPCRIGGAEIRCRAVTVGSGTGRVVSLLGAAIVAGTPVFALCTQPAGLEGVHPVCAPVISFQGAP